MEKKLITSPTETTETKIGIVGAIPNPKNIIEKVINLLRKQK